MTEVQLNNLAYAVDQHKLSDQNVAQLLKDDESYMDEIIEEEQTQVMGASIPVVVASVIAVTGVAAADSSFGCAGNAAGITGGLGASVGAIVDFFD